MENWILIEGHKPTLPLEELTPGALKFIERHDVLKYDGDIIQAWYRGDKETTEEWVLVTGGDASFYKIGAQFMIWTPTIVRAAWSPKSAVKMVTAYVSGREVPQDPGYQT